MLPVDLLEDSDAPAALTHLGFQLGSQALVERLAGLEQIGVNHVVLDLRYCRRPIGEVLFEIGERVAPHFSPHATFSQEAFA